MRLTVAKARSLVERVMEAIGYEPSDARLIADHLIDCELRGLHYGGLARALSIAERLAHTDHLQRPIRIEKETPVSARIDGGDGISYVVAYRATQTAIVKAEGSGIAIVGATNTGIRGCYPITRRLRRSAVSA